MLDHVRPSFGPGSAKAILLTPMILLFERFNALYTAVPSNVSVPEIVVLPLISALAKTGVDVPPSK